MLTRNKSVKTFSRQPQQIDNAYISLSQKDKIISLLRSQVQSYNSLYENISRLKEKKNSILDKCDSLHADTMRNKDFQERKQFNDEETTKQLSSVLKMLQKQLKDKSFYLRELRNETNKLSFESQNKATDFQDCCGDIQAKKNNSSLYRIQRQRLQNQIQFLKQEIMKLQNYQKKSLSSIQKIRDQGLESEIYIRNLTLQEHKLNDEITMIQTDTENGEKILDELSAVQNANKNKIREQIEQNQSLQLQIKKKQIEKGRIEKKKSEALLRLRQQQQRQRQIAQKANKKKAQMNNLTNILKNQLKPQILNLKNQNTEAFQMNSQLKNDFSYCENHLENLIRTNKILNDQLNNIEKVTKNVIKMLIEVNNGRKQKNLRMQQPRISKRQTGKQDLGLKSREPFGEIIGENTYRSQSKLSKKEDFDFYDTADHLSKGKNSRIM